MKAVEDASRTLASRTQEFNSRYDQVVSERDQAVRALDAAKSEAIEYQRRTSSECTS